MSICSECMTHLSMPKSLAATKESYCGPDLNDLKRMGRTSRSAELLVALVPGDAPSWGPLPYLIRGY